MSWTYVALSAGADGKIRARITGDGKPPHQGHHDERGGSRYSGDGRFAVFRIDEFEGLDVIPTDALHAELLNRHGGVEGLIEALRYEIPLGTLARWLAGRIGD